jgi:hypothetical protein
MSPSRLRILRLAALVGSLALIAIQVVLVARGWDYYQYDFRAYYIGAALHAEQQDPYSLEALRAYREDLGLRSNDHAFLYAPYMLWVFAPLAALQYSTAFFLWLILQVTALATMAWLTIRYLRPDPVVFTVLLAVGLNGTIASVLRTGQIELISLALILGGLALVSKHRLIGATALLTIAAIPKLWPAPMLSLLIRRFERQRIALAIAGVAVLIGLMITGALLHPDYHAAFAATLGEFADRGQSVGPQNGSLQNLLMTGFLSTGGSAETARFWWMGAAAVIGAAAAIRYVQATQVDEVNLAYLFSIVTLSLCLVIPRVMIYQWCFALPALAYVITNMQSRAGASMLFLVAVVPTLYINRYAFGLDTYERIDNALILPWAFSNLLVVFCAWVILIVKGPKTVSEVQVENAGQTSGAVMEERAGQKGA